MFDKEFYPTPKHVIKKMLQPYIKEGKISRNYGRHGYIDEEFCHMKGKFITMLEPEAGKGDICDYVRELAGDQVDIYCIERNKELQFILQGKGYRVIAEDFLNYSGDYHFDLILMNPPFSTGDKHLLKAWDILEEGEIVCLLNSETLNNPYTETRKLLAAIIEQHGETESIGNAFADSARVTNVDISIVRLKKKPASNRFKFDFKNVTKETTHKLDESTFTNPIATRDVIGNMIIQFDKLKETFVEFLKVRQAMNFYSTGIFDQPGRDSIWSLLSHLDYSKGSGHAYNQLSNAVKKTMWIEVLSKTNVEKYMTHDVRTNFTKFQDAQGCLDFTKENIAQVIQFVFENRYTIMDKAVVDVFDLFCKYDKDNRCHVEGWKTNDKWKVNRKIILPYGVSYGSYCTTQSLKDHGDRFRANHNRHSEYSDIDKVMCYLTGTDFESCTGIYRTLDRHFDKLEYVRTGDNFDSRCESEFFHLKFFKKGTLHLEFKDEKLWQEFNLRACAGKNWLPDDERQAYEETTRKSREKAKAEAAEFNRQLLLPSAKVEPQPLPEIPVREIPVRKPAKLKKQAEYLQPTIF